MLAHHINKCVTLPLPGSPPQQHCFACLPTQQGCYSTASLLTTATRVFLHRCQLPTATRVLHLCLLSHHHHIDVTALLVTYCNSVPQQWCYNTACQLTTETIVLQVTFLPPSSSSPKQNSALNNLKLLAVLRVNSPPVQKNITLKIHHKLVYCTVYSIA